MESTKHLKFSMILPWLLIKATGQNRYKPKIEWSSKSWTHNIFRLWELAFWRREGVRAEISATISKGKITYRAHSFEGMCALFEQWARSFRIVPIEVRIPILSFAGPFQQQDLKFKVLFAIAYDNSALGVGPVSQSFTTAGSNRMLVFSYFNLSTLNDPNIATYNSVSMTKLSAASLNGGNVRGGIFYLNNPTVGANTIVVSNSFDTIECDIMSFSGANGTVQNFASGFVASAFTTLTITSSAGTSIIFSGVFYANGSGSSITGNGLTIGTTDVGHNANGYVISATATVGFNNGSANNAYQVGCEVQAQTSTAWTQNLTETLTLTDTITKSTTRLLIESLTLTDVLSKGRSFVKTLTESFTLTDSLRVLLNGMSAVWTRLTKHNASLSNQNKNNSSWTNQSKS